MSVKVTVCEESVGTVHMLALGDNSSSKDSEQLEYNAAASNVPNMTMLFLLM